MTALTGYTSYADAHRRFSRRALWALFDGDRERLNIAHECLDRHPRGRRAVRIARADGPPESFDFGTLSDMSGRVANWLARRGVARGERVAIVLDPSLAFYATLFGTMKAGAVATPLFTAFGPDGLAARFEDCAPVLAILAPEKAGLAGLAGVDCVVADDAFLAELMREEPGFAPDTSSADMAMYQYTSGTSRELPEAVRHRHRAVVTVAIAALYATGVRPGDRFMCPSSPAWGHGLWHGTLAPLALGVEVAAWTGKFDPLRLFDALEEFGIDNLSAAATHYRMMRLAGAGAGRRLPLRKLSFTGEPIDGETADWARATFGEDVRSIYGSTEVGVIVAGYPGARDLPARPGSLGKPLPGCEVAILDPEGRPRAPGEIGEIVLRRAGGDWFRVKDLGHVDEDGYFFHHGRADDAIISAGWTLSAVEIEDALLKHPDVGEAAAIGVPDPERGQAVKAFVVSGRAGSDGFAGELREIARSRLGRHAWPRHVAFVAALPKTPAGKVNRKALRDRERARREEEEAA